MVEVTKINQASLVSLSLWATQAQARQLFLAKAPNALFISTDGNATKIGLVTALFIFDFKWNLTRFATGIHLFNIFYLGLGASAICFVIDIVRILGAIKIAYMSRSGSNSGNIRHYST